MAGNPTPARSRRGAVAAALAVCLLLAAAHLWLASGMVPALLLVAGQARRAARRTEERR